MKIGVISDTHLDVPNPSLEMIAGRYFKDVEFIFHAGDIHALEVLDVFKGKKVFAVAGNNDRPEVEKRFPTKQLIEIGGYRFGLTHGRGFPFGLQKRALSLFEGIHCLVFGHSHWPVNRNRNGILYFNPGAFRRGPVSLWRRTIGILTIGRGIKGEIIRV